MMEFFQNIAFASPAALAGLAALPVIWWLLRFTPPKPRSQKFPPIRILLGLPTQDETPDKTPWWLLLIRLALAAIVIFAAAQPFHQPKATSERSAGPRLIVIDDGWAAAQNWNERRQSLLEELDAARADYAPVILAKTAPSPVFQDLLRQPAHTAMDVARTLKPSPLATDRPGLVARLRDAELAGIESIIWLSDGIDAGSSQQFAKDLKGLIPTAMLRILAPKTTALPFALGPPEFASGSIKIQVMKPQGVALSAATLAARATNGRTLAEIPASFDSRNSATVTLELPTVLRNEIQSISIAGQNHAGARQLFDDRWRKRTIAMQAGESLEQAQPLLSSLHYVSRGLEPFAELFEPQTSADVSGLIDAGLSMLVLADIGALPDDLAKKLGPWIDKGGILLRFAGPRLAASHDALLPVRLREGDRTLGSALSWETPQGLQPFPDSSPFAGLAIDPRITVSRQILAEPDTELASKTWASLADGTPLVTAERKGKGLMVLFHVTANASWSNLPLSGLFIEMLQRVAGLDPTSDAGAVTDTTADSYVPRLALSGIGELVSPDGSAQSIPASAIATVTASATFPPGIYARGGKEHALNLNIAEANLAPMAAIVGGVSVASYEPQQKTPLAPYLFMAALAIFLFDAVAAFIIGGGRLRLGNAPAAIAALAVIAWFDPTQAVAQSDGSADMQAALSPRLAYVETGNAEIDKTSIAGLKGLTLILSDRTSAALAEPAAVNIENDEIVFYPLIYWPVDDNAQALSEAARNKVSRYMKNGGTVFFDLRNGGLDTGNGATAALQRLLDKLDIPPLEPVPDDHVIARSFYLLSTFPGRYEGAPLWVESALGDPSSDPGTADGVSAIIIGANDYAAAWALDDRGEPLYAVVPGSDRQRELSFRTGVNIVMYALTGNYKADQVHVPALLERLGQ